MKCRWQLSEAESAVKHANARVTDLHGELLRLEDEYQQTDAAATAGGGENRLQSLRTRDSRQTPVWTRRNLSSPGGALAGQQGAF